MEKVAERERATLRLDVVRIDPAKTPVSHVLPKAVQA